VSLLAIADFILSEFNIRNSWNSLSWCVSCSKVLTFFFLSLFLSPKRLYLKWFQKLIKDLTILASRF